jgi:hypothetical protein
MALMKVISKTVTRGVTPEDADAPRKRSKRTKTAVEDNSVAPSLRGCLLLVVDFDQYAWEIMYPHFVEEVLVDPPGRVDK